MQLRTKTARLRLTPKTNPYYDKLSKGRALGYRKRVPQSSGKWVLRTADDLGAYSYETLGNADDFDEPNGKNILSYGQALKIALTKKSADPNRKLVTEALNDWAVDKNRTASSEKQRLDNFSRARRISTPFEGLNLKTVKQSHIKKWRDDHLTDPERGQPQRSTANRNLAVLKAALNKAAYLTEFEGPYPWRLVSKYKKSESFGKRLIILTDQEEENIISHARSDLANLLRGLQKTGARFGELRQCLCSDLNGNRLRIPDGKTGARTIALSLDKAAFFKNLTEKQAPSSPLLKRTDGTAWPDNGHLKPMRALVVKLGLSADITSYAFRHGFISRALSKGVPMSAVAQHCGTSEEMIRKSYAKFHQAQMQEWFS